MWHVPDAGISAATQMITASTALVAVVVGPFVSARIARRQIKASVVSANRQLWINALRDTISEFLAKEAMARNLNRHAHADQDSLIRIEEILRLNHRIELLINPREEDHARLVTLISDLTNTINRSNKEDNNERTDERRQDVVALSQMILKREWERVKRGE